MKYALSLILFVLMFSSQAFADHDSLENLGNDIIILLDFTGGA